MNKIKSSLVLLGVLIIFMVFSCSKDSTVTSEATGNNTSSSSPNVIFIIADDMGWDAFGNSSGFNGVKANTPTIDSLAQTGITFSNFWTSPICAPTRASMLTGKFPFRTGIGGVQIPQQATLQSSETILQKYISDNTFNKYESAVIGKWHVNSSSELNAPEDFGVDYYSGIFLGAVPDYYNWTETSSGMQQNVTTYATTHMVNQSINWVEAQSKPFFLWLAFNAPHTPFHRPPLNLISDQTLTDNQATIDANPLPYYLASIEAMDKEISRLIDSLTLEQKENTVFVFIGDNGTPNEVSQAPYVSNKVKGTLFQGGINAPLIISGKNVTRQNILETALVSTPDIFVTIADIAGAGNGTYEDGMSLKPLLADASATQRAYNYSEQFGSTNTTNDGYTLQKGSYKYINLDNGNEYFYELNSNPFEQNNLMSGTLSASEQLTLDELIQIKADL
jgi:arylsulfatase A-like enzyme